MRLAITIAFIVCLTAFVSAEVVKNTKHNLSPTGTNQAIQAASGTLGNEVCVYCHTPHGGSTKAPLWNRPDSSLGTGTYTKYSSTTMDATQPTDATIIASVSGACLSCHDGTVALDSVVNFQGASVTGSGTFTTTTNAEATYGASGGGTNNIMTGGLPFLGTDLANDHPIHITYETARAAQTPSEFNTQTLSGSKITVTDGTTTLPLYGSSTANATVECGSCHNPHDSANDPFLRASNGGSAVCYACHVK